jgi:hypothetical protein
VTIRIRYVRTWRSSRLAHLEMGTLGYDLDQVVAAVRDWWALRRAGRQPHIWIERSR